MNREEAMKALQEARTHMAAAAKILAKVAMYYDCREFDWGFSAKAIGLRAESMEAEVYLLWLRLRDCGRHEAKMADLLEMAKELDEAGK